MRLDHVSYVASHEQISDVVNRIGSQLRTNFIDGGIHPQFGTRNFTAPLSNGMYIEVVCPLEHPSTEISPFGRMVKKKVLMGGGWMSWAFSVEDINKIEIMLNRKSVDGHRRKPDGAVLRWKQIGILPTTTSPHLPFFVQWLSDVHPSSTGSPVAQISRITLANKSVIDDPWVSAVESANSDGVNVEWGNNAEADRNEGIEKIVFNLGNTTIVII
jgi:hypothetical protein